MTDSKAAFFHNKNAVFSNSVVKEVPLVPKSTTRIYHLHFDPLQQMLIADFFFFFVFHIVVMTVIQNEPVNGNGWYSMGCDFITKTCLFKYKENFTSKN